MSSNDKKQHFIDLLHELFQLDQPELDFGFYKIMHAKSGQVQRFINEELSRYIDEAFAGQDNQSAEDKLAQARHAVLEAIGEDAFEGDELKDQYKNTNFGKAFLETRDELRTGGALSDDAQVYDHLYRFFSRYYDQGDFLSTRYRQAPSDTRDAPYSVPYDGREVYLHWANKDQYYIKSSETLRDYRFDLNAAVRGLAGSDHPQGGLDFGAGDDTPRHVQFRIVDAAEGAHGNVKENEQRFFLIHQAEPVQLDGDELIIQFEYRPDPDKTGQNKKWQETRLAEAQGIILDALDDLGKDGAAFKQALRTPAPTEKDAERTLLAKHLAKYTARHTMDYFIHKDLGGFLRRELDFYIKNEVMRLDHIEAADAPSVEDYLGKVKVIRKIARRIITFLAQLEDFQKKLWLKKKFVTETNYCITLDRVPKRFYPEIATNEPQIQEWKTLFSIGDLDGFSVPLTEGFLEQNKYLVVDTYFLSDELTERIISDAENLDSETSGTLFNSDNFQGLELIQGKYTKSIDYIYADPPYNTASTPILYKNNYKHSSWASLIFDRLRESNKLLKENGVNTIAIDDKELFIISDILNSIYDTSRITKVAVVHNPKGSITKDFNRVHEYAIFCTSEYDDRAISRSIRKNERPRKMRRWGANSLRVDRRPSFYPIYVQDGEITRVGQVPPDEYHPSGRNEPQASGEIAIWPIDPDGTERRWNFGLDTIHKNLNRITALDTDGTLDLFVTHEVTVPKTVWSGGRMDAGKYGNTLLSDILGEKRFDFPKSIHLVKDCISLGAGKTSSPIILDYFAGSGTTAHAVIDLNREDIVLNREDPVQRDYICIEIGAHFDSVLLPRLKKVIYAKEWQSGTPRPDDSGCLNGISHFFKYIRLESYEDALNNLVLHEDADREAALEADDGLRHDYLLHYWLDTETRGSQSLLNIEHFRDPTNYRMRIKQPGSDESREQPVDLVETFSWLIGLHVELLDKPRAFAAEFERETDPDLPEDAATRLRVEGRLREREDGGFWFRMVEGWVARTPGSTEDVDKVLVIWRKLTDDPEQDAAVLETLLTQHLRINQRDTEFDAIYINGPHGLSTDFEGKYRLHSLEEAFHAAMWAEE